MTPARASWRRPPFIWCQWWCSAPCLHPFTAKYGSGGETHAVLLWCSSPGLKHHIYTGGRVKEETRKYFTVCPGTHWLTGILYLPIGIGHLLHLFCHSVVCVCVGGGGWGGAVLWKTDINAFPSIQSASCADKHTGQDTQRAECGLTSAHAPIVLVQIHPWSFPLETHPLCASQSVPVSQKHIYLQMISWMCHLDS